MFGRVEETQMIRSTRTSRNRATKALCVVLAVSLAFGMVPFNADAQATVENPDNAMQQAGQAPDASASGAEASEAGADPGAALGEGQQGSSDDGADSAAVAGDAEGGTADEEAARPDAATSGDADDADAGGDQMTEGSGREQLQPQEDAVVVAETSPANFQGAQWQVDSSGTLIIGPQDGQAEGWLGFDMPDPASYDTDHLQHDFPWSSTSSGVATSIQSVRFTGTVHLKNDCSKLFEGLKNARTIDFTGVETSECKLLKMAFNSCSSLASIDLSAFSAAKLLRIQSMFQECSKLTSVDLSCLDLSEITSLNYLFSWCSQLKTVNFGAQNMSNVVKANSAFDYCSCLEEPGLGNVTLGAPLESMAQMFRSCSALTKLDLSGFQCSPSTDAYNAFDGDKKLGELVLGPNFSFGAATTRTPALYCTEWKGPDGVSRLTDDLYAQYTSSIAGTYVNNEVFAVLYDGTELVFQHGSDVDATRESKVFNATQYSGEPGWKQYNASVTRVVVAEPIAPLNMADWFYGMSKITGVEGLDKIDTSKVTSMSNLFYRCTSLQSVDLSGFTAEKVTSVLDMFEDCKALTSVTFGRGDAPALTTVHGMFKGCTSLTSVDLGGFTTPKLKTMDNMFKECSSLQSVDLSSFDTSKVTSVKAMFAVDKQLNTVKLGTFEMNALSSAMSMFEGCSELANLDVSWTASPALTDTELMFSGCAKLGTLDLRNINLDKVTNLTAMFRGCSSLVTCNLTGVKSESANTARNMFSECTSLKELDLAGFDFTQHADTLDIERMFDKCTSLEKLTLGPKFTSGAKKQDPYLPGNQWLNEQTGNTYISETLFPNYDGATMAGTYVRQTYNALLYESGKLVFQLGDTPDPSEGSLVGAFAVPRALSGVAGYERVGWGSWCKQVTTVSFKDALWPNTMRSWFSGCENLTTFEGLENLHTDYVLSFEYLFDGCTGLTSIDLSHFKTGTARAFNYLFRNCKALTQVDLSALDFTNATSMSSLFENCANLQSVTFPTTFGEGDKTRYFSSFFSGCTSLTSLDLSAFSTTKISNSTSMFKNCTGLVELDLSSFRSGSSLYASGMFSGASNLGKITFGSEWLWATPSGDDAKLAGTWARDVDYQARTLADIRSTWNSASAGTYYRQIDVTFDATGGTVTPSVVPIRYGHAFGSSLPVPQRDNYDFAGWYTDKFEGTRIQADTPYPSVQTTLYARWTPLSYTLVLDANDLSGRRQLVPLKYDETYTLGRNLFPRENAMIMEWNTHPSGTGTSYLVGDDVSMLADADGQVVLYAQWKRLALTIRFDAQGGTPVDDRHMAEGDVYGAPPETTRDGYSFRGWYTKPDSGGVSYAADKIASADAVYYARWAKKPVVTFDANGGTAGVDSMTLEYGAAISPLPAASRPGYQFQGWFDTSNRQLTTTTTFVSDKTYKAKWKIGPSYNLNGIGMITAAYSGSDTNADPTAYVIPGFPTVESHDHVLVGWFTQPTGGTEVHVGSVIDATTTPVVYAHWEEVPKITVAFDSAGGSTVASRTLFKGETLVELPTPTRSGYRFVGWSKVAGDESALIGADTAFDENTTLHALWRETSTKYRVLFNANGSSATVHGSTTYYMDVVAGETISVMPGCTRTGYVFDGWYTDQEAGDLVTSATPITANQTLYAHWRDPAEHESAESTQATLSTYWTTKSSATVENTGVNIDLHPTSYNSVRADLFVELEVAEVEAGSTIPIGAAVIRVPKYLFKDWSGNPTGAISNMATQLALYPGKSKGMSFSYREGIDYYEMVNVEELSSDTTFGITLTYSVNPQSVPGGRINADGSYDGGSHSTVPVSLAVDANADGTPEISHTTNLTAEFHSNLVSSHTLTSTTPTVYYEWQSSWGTKTEDGDDYFYVSWPFRSTSQASSHETLDVSWNFDAPHDGELVKVSSASGTISARGGSHAGTVVMRYPKTMLAQFGTTPVVLRNQAVVHETWQSGTQADRVVLGAVTVAQDQTSVGSLNKTHSSPSNGIVAGGQETIIDDVRRATMTYRIDYEGHDTQPPTYDSVSGTYTLPQC